MTYVEKTSYFEIAPPGHTIAYKNIDILLKTATFMSLFVIQPQNVMSKKVKTITDVPQEV